MKLLLSLILASQLYVAEAQVIDRQDTIKQKIIDRQQIETKIKKDYNLDSLKINFEVLPIDANYPFFGTYSSWCDSLKLNYYEIINYAQRDSLDSNSFLEQIMNHELAHYRTDKIREQFNIKPPMEKLHLRNIANNYFMLLGDYEKDQNVFRTNLQNFINMNEGELTEIILDKVIDEGIAVCYQYPNSSPIATSWPTSVKDIQSYVEFDRYLYCAGWNLMYPIISTYGIKGIEYVLKNMPSNDDFSNLQDYQKRVLEKLSK